ncbi:MAG: carboxypeptidase-like regulatory domain-containing protein [Planctomycetota bacterium]
MLSVDQVPLSGARASIGRKQAWPESALVTDLPDMPGYTGLSTNCDEQGRFRLVIPELPEGGLVFYVSAGPLWEDYREGYGFASNSKPALQPGEQDLGDFLFGPTACIQGKVTDAAGRAISEARVRPASRLGNALGRDTRTKKDGSFEVGQAPPGNYGIAADCEGYLSTIVPLPEIQVGQRYDQVLVVMETAPTIQGRVTEPGGNPIEGATVSGWPSKAGGFAETKTDGEGRFRLAPPTNVAYALEARKDGYAVWGNGSDRSRVFEPGTTDLAITLEPIEQTRFHVVDATTGEALSHYAFNLWSGHGSLGSNRSKHVLSRRPGKPRPGGIVEASAQPGKDSVYVCAPGYRIWVGDVQWDQPDRMEQTIRLERGSGVRGRVLRDGTPVGGVAIQVHAVRPEFALEKDFSKIQAGIQPEITGWRQDSNSLQQLETDPAGAFVCTGLEPGYVQVQVLPTEGAPLYPQPVLLAANEGKDLGDLLLQQPAAVQGQVLLPPGVEPGGLRIQFDNGSGDDGTPVDARGRFRMENLPAGTFRFYLQASPGKIAKGAQAQVELHAGRTTEVLIDARAFGYCRVSLRVTIGGQPAAGYQVQLSSLELQFESANLLALDAQGNFAGDARAHGKWKLVIFGDQATYQIETPLDLTDRSTYEDHIDIQSGSLCLELPEGIELPRDGYLFVNLDPAPGIDMAPRYHFRFQEEFWSKARFLPKSPETSSPSPTNWRAPSPAAFKSERCRPSPEWKR